jgi:hypothetical protein
MCVAMHLNSIGQRIFLVLLDALVAPDWKREVIMKLSYNKPTFQSETLRAMDGAMVDYYLKAGVQIDSTIIVTCASGSFPYDLLTGPFKDLCLLSRNLLNDKAHMHPAAVRFYDNKKTVIAKIENQTDHIWNQLCKIARWEPIDAILISNGIWRAAAVRYHARHLLFKDIVEDDRTPFSGKSLPGQLGLVVNAAGWTSLQTIAGGMVGGICIIHDCCNVNYFMRLLLFLHSYTMYACM